MLYPRFLEKNDIIGITAPSQGVGDHLESFKKSIKTLEEYGYKIKETASVRNKGMVSTTGEKRSPASSKADISLRTVALEHFNVLDIVLEPTGIGSLIYFSTINFKTLHCLSVNMLPPPTASTIIIRVLIVLYDNL